MSPGDSRFCKTEVATEQQACTRAPTAAASTTAETGKRPECARTDGRMKKASRHRMGRDSDMEKECHLQG